MTCPISEPNTDIIPPPIFSPNIPAPIANVIGTQRRKIQAGSNKNPPSP